MRKTIATIAALIAGAFALAEPAAAQPVERAEASINSYPICEQEDSVACVWPADEVGNGEGLSYIVYPDGTMNYWVDRIPAGWTQLDAGWREAMRSEDPTRDYAACLIQVADTTTVVCQDGWTWRS